MVSKAYRVFSIEDEDDLRRPGGERMGWRYCSDVLPRKSFIVMSKGSQEVPTRAASAAAVDIKVVVDSGSDIAVNGGNDIAIDRAFIGAAIAVDVVVVSADEVATAIAGDIAVASAVLTVSIAVAVEVGDANAGHLDHFAGMRVRLRRSVRGNERVLKPCASTTSKQVGRGEQQKAELNVLWKVERVVNLGENQHARKVFLSSALLLRQGHVRHVTRGNGRSLAEIFKTR